MPVSPDLAMDLAKATRDVYVAAEIDLLAKVARRTARGITEPGWTERKLAEIQDLRREVQATIADLASSSAETVTEAVTTAYNRGASAAGADLTKVGVSRQVAFAAVDLAKVETLVSAAIGTVQSTHLRIFRSTLDGYRDVITGPASQVIVGAATRREAAQQALDAFARRGVTGFVDNAGRSWDLASYTEMATRTATGQAAVQGHVDQLGQAGHNLVIVSEHTQECPLCRPWEGKVLSISGGGVGTVSGVNVRGAGTITTHVDGTLDEARGAGLFHPSCRHTLGAYVPGLSVPVVAEADPDGYAERMEQRRLERGVREWKRREAVAITPDAQTRSRAKVREWQSRSRAHAAGTGQRRRYDRESITGAR